MRERERGMIKIEPDLTDCKSVCVCERERERENEEDVEFCMTYHPKKRIIFTRMTGKKLEKHTHIHTHTLHLGLLNSIDKKKSF